jgi:serine/threonine-protein kinase RsbW
MFDWERASVRTPEEMPPVLDAVTAAMRARGYPERDRFGMRLALAEALANALKHGHRGDTSKVARVRYRITAAQARAVVEDEGPGFDPAAVADPLAEENLDRPCGRGLLLMRHYLTSIRYHGCGNCVTLCRCRSMS